MSEGDAEAMSSEFESDGAVEPLPDGHADLTEKQDRGVLKQIQTEGTGDARPRKGNEVTVHYVGTLLADGSQFDSSRERAQPFEFTLGRGQVIKAWDLGVSTMRKGEVARLVCAAPYAYGASGSPPKIPADATLVFEVELISWQGEDVSPDKDASITRQQIVEGERYANPNDAALVTLDVSASHEGRLFYEAADVQFELGEGTENGLPEGVDAVLKKFNRGERSVLRLAPKWGYGAAGKAEWLLPADATIDVDVTLKSFEKAKDAWEMNAEEKLDESDKLKTRGADFFKTGKLRLASGKFERVVSLLEYEKKLDEALQPRRDALVVAAHANLALCHLKDGRPLACAEQCDKALLLAPDNVKALYRRAQAREELSDFEVAMADYDRVLALEPENAAARNKLAACRRRLDAHHAAEKRRYAAMFDKFAAVDAKRNAKQDAESRAKAFPNAAPPADDAAADAADAAADADAAEVNGAADSVGVC